MPDSVKPQSVVPSEETLFKVLTRIGLAIGVPIQRSDMQSCGENVDPQQDDPLSPLLVSAKHAELILSETKFSTVEELFGFVRERYPILIVHSDGRYDVLETIAGRRLHGSQISDLPETPLSTKPQTYSKSQLRKWLRSDPPPRCFACRKELPCDSISSARATRDYLMLDSHANDHPTPLHRFLGLLHLDRRDIFTVILFAFVAGILALATPLAVESLVNVVSWGTYVQPLIVLGLMLLTCLGIAGVLKVLQAIGVELIQRRQFVRIVSDLAHRFPRANQASLVGEFPRELANRVFDIMTIQKATAVLLLDGVTIVLTTVLGLFLLAFYHPFLLGFDIVLIISMISITWLLGRGGIHTSIDESITKYRVAHWLQDVIASPSVFKLGGGETLAVQRANQLTAQYIAARQLQFRVVIRQVVFAISLQVIASTVLLALGGWLVIDGQLTLGQLVASELVVTVVVGAFAKAGKSIEKFYDLMAGIDKVGHLIDLPVDAKQEPAVLPHGPAEIQWSDLILDGGVSKSKVPAATIDAGSRVAIVGDDVNGRTLLARTLAGLTSPVEGTAQVAGHDPVHAAATGEGRFLGYAGANDLFHGSLRENLDLARSGMTAHRLREALNNVGLLDLVLQMPDGLQSRLQTHGYPLSDIQSRQLVLARAILMKPKLLVVDGLLDDLASEDRRTVWQILAAEDAPWTLVVTTNRQDVAELCEIQIAVRKGA
ncbi:ATP-binding cassette domain-containing protein [Novipirellula sp. SH528]|uniref:ATP-binding cassette domain-containing protein n=1 Tax=Novipirellula sp. SH528 TaxID=3454466 RepID=UPI003F9F4BC9